MAKVIFHFRKFIFAFFRDLPWENDVYQRAHIIADDYGVPEAYRNFMAISLWKADKEKFEIEKVYRRF